MKPKIILLNIFLLCTIILQAQTVTNTNNDGAGSLRQAILDANANPGIDNITFNIPGTGPHTIQLTLALPEITDAVVIDGYTQPDAAPASETTDAILMIELDGTNAGDGADGLSISAGNSTVKGLVINRFQGDQEGHGIELSENGGNTIEGNLIGTDVTGTTSQGNLGYGINIINSDGNLIGGATPSQRNIISGNRYGIYIREASNNIIIGNYIGTNTGITSSSLGNEYYGVYIGEALNTQIGGTAPGEGNVISNHSLVSGVNRFGYGIYLSGADGVNIQGNFIGTDPTGTIRLGNDHGIGLSGSENVLIGGVEPAMRNVISGNSAGILVRGGSHQTLNNRIFGNYIGTDVSGTQQIYNYNGIRLDASHYFTIGGTNSGEGNLISGNGTGINIYNSSNTSLITGSYNTILGNLIGTDASGTNDLGNGTGIACGYGTEETTIGGTSPEARNVISGNGTGISIYENNNHIKGNYIGVGIDGTVPLGNTVAGIKISPQYASGAKENIIGGIEAGAGNIIAYNGIGIRSYGNETYGDPKYNAFLGNSIYENIGLGIDLETEGVTANDDADVDEGANGTQNYPILTSVINDETNTTIEGALNSTPDATFQLQFFSNTSVDPSDFGEGETYIGETSVTTDAGGNASFIVALPVIIPQGYFITSTATSSDKSTSEFSEGILLFHYVIIPDPNFEQALINLGIDSDETINQQILKSDAEAVTCLNVDSKNIADLTGIEAFTNLTSLICSKNQLTSLDVTQNTALTHLACYENQLPGLDVTQNTALTDLRCYSNQLTSLDVTQNKALTYLWCTQNQLTSIDVTQNTALTTLGVGTNKLASLNVTQNTALTHLTCSNNQLTSLDVTHNTALTGLYCIGNQFTSLDVTQNTALTHLACYENQLTSLDVTHNTALTGLHCQSNQLTSLDMTHNTALTHLACFNNQLTSLDVTQNTALTVLNCSINQLTSLDVTQNTALTILWCYTNQLTSLDMRNGNNELISGFSSINNYLTCVNVDDELADHTDWLVDPGVIFSNDCGYNTQRGANVAVLPVDETTQTTPVEVTFEGVTSSGNTYLVISSEGPVVPEGFGFGNPPTYFNIETTAEYSGNIQIVIDYSGIEYANEAGLRLLHYESDQWVDGTTMLDTENDKIYGEFMNLSSFAVLKDIEPPVLIGVPADETVECNAIPDPAVVNAEDNVNGSVPVILSEETLDGSCPNSYTLVRTWTATDACGNVATAVQVISVNDITPPVITGIPTEPIIQGNDQDKCGALVNYPEITATDNCSDPVNLTLDPLSGSFFPVGITTVTVTANDDCGNTATAYFNVEITNDIPVIKNLVAPSDPVQLGVIVNTSAEFTDNNLFDAVWDWGDGTSSAGMIDGQTITGDHLYDIPGVYILTLTISDMCGETDTEIYQYVVVYDPNGGFITGGGWINSPPGAYVDDPLLEGKANFGFVSKYKKGEDIPEGNTEFQFNAGDLKFKSTSYYWLVIAGSKAKFKGDGSVNDVGNYGFMISAIDGDLKDNGEDRFRIKIWDIADETVIYDNEIEADENQDPTTELGGGSIVIHIPKTKGSGVYNEELVSFGNDGDIIPTMLIYPNPAKDYMNIIVSGKEEQSIELKIYNSTGQLVHISSGKGMINEEISLEDNKSGLYSVIAVVNNKLIIQKVLIE